MVFTVRPLTRAGMAARTERATKYFIVVEFSRECVVQRAEWVRLGGPVQRSSSSKGQKPRWAESEERIATYVGARVSPGQNKRRPNS